MPLYFWEAYGMATVIVVCLSIPVLVREIRTWMREDPRMLDMDWGEAVILAFFMLVLVALVWPLGPPLVLAVKIARKVKQLREKEKMMDQEMFEKAGKLTLAEYARDEPLGMIYCEAARSQETGDDSDFYHADFESFMGALRAQKRGPLVLADVPEYVLPCTSTALYLNADNILEQELEAQEFFEGAIDHVSEEDLAALTSFLEFWCRKVDLKTWMVDESRAIVLSKEERQAALEKALGAPGVEEHTDPGHPVPHGDAADE